MRIKQLTNTRSKQIAKFYEHLDQLRRKVGGLKDFQSYDYINRLPDSGVEFYFEKGEVRTDSKQLRVVRIGASVRLMDRLNDHESGEIGGSVFRRHLRRALLNRQKKLNKNRPIGERDITNYMLDNIQFLILPVSHGPIREFIKDATISLLSNYSFVEQINQPTPEWLGNDSIDTRGCPYDKIIESGLWNVQGVKSANCDFELFLEEFEKLVDEAIKLII